jgi:integrase
MEVSLMQSVAAKRKTTMHMGLAIEAFLQNVSNMSKATSESYRYRLHPFVRYARFKHSLTPDELVARIKAQKCDVYDILSDYAGYRQAQAKKNGGRGSATIKGRINVVKDVLTFKDIDISDTKFKAKVKLPKKIKRKKAAIDKLEVIRIIQACDDIKTRTYLMTLAATGMRAKEALSIQFQGLDFKSNPPRINIRGEYTKTRTERFVYMTNELVRQLQDYFSWRQRERDIYYCDENGKGHTVTFKPEMNPHDLFFGIPHRDPRRNANVDSLYKEMLVQVNAVVDRVGLGEIDPNSGYRKVTRHSFRRFVKTTISNLGYGDYSEWFIGHVGSEYYTAKEHEAVAIFRKIESYLTFQDIVSLEAKGADQSTQLEQLRDDLQKEREERAKLYDQLYRAGVIKKE